ncbi:hypothetical protein BCF59_0500 [Mycoplasmopsis mustelae]|uniref:Uncharacterized protein n=1 Tax=Mycoplasmopsis mustelae TaxID=171289 RepID=A0A4R7UC43_9BACT|nr:hypothetical protein [Mycoplasmopsis mustelae]TDV23511.1 hypothetical protein BCF59_0500 [Mycoplasmopsis mustelae]
MKLIKKPDFVWVWAFFKFITNNFASDVPYRDSTKSAVEQEKFDFMRTNNNPDDVSNDYKNFNFSIQIDTGQKYLSEVKFATINREKFDVEFFKQLKVLEIALNYKNLRLSDEMFEKIKLIQKITKRDRIVSFYEIPIDLSNNQIRNVSFIEVIYRPFSDSPVFNYFFYDGVSKKSFPKFLKVKEMRSGGVLALSKEKENFYFIKFSDLLTTESLESVAVSFSMLVDIKKSEFSWLSDFKHLDFNESYNNNNFISVAAIDSFDRVFFGEFNSDVIRNGKQKWEKATFIRLDNWWDSIYSNSIDYFKINDVSGLYVSSMTKRLNEKNEFYGNLLIATSAESVSLQLPQEKTSGDVGASVFIDPISEHARDLKDLLISYITSQNRNNNNLRPANNNGFVIMIDPHTLTFRRKENKRSYLTHNGIIPLTFAFDAILSVSSDLDLENFIRDAYLISKSFVRIRLIMYDITLYKNYDDLFSLYTAGGLYIDNKLATHNLRNRKDIKPMVVDIELTYDEALAVFADPLGVQVEIAQPNYDGFYYSFDKLPDYVYQKKEKQGYFRNSSWDWGFYFNNSDESGRENNEIQRDIKKIMDKNVFFPQYIPIIIRKDKKIIKVFKWKNTKGYYDFKTKKYDDETGHFGFDPTLPSDKQLGYFGALINDMEIRFQFDFYYNGFNEVKPNRGQVFKIAIREHKDSKNGLIFEKDKVVDDIQKTSQGLVLSSNEIYLPIKKQGQWHLYCFDNSTKISEANRVEPTQARYVFNYSDYLNNIEGIKLLRIQTDDGRYGNFISVINNKIFGIHVESTSPGFIYKVNCGFQQIDEATSEYGCSVGVDSVNLSQFIHYHLPDGFNFRVDFLAVFKENYINKLLYFNDNRYTFYNFQWDSRPHNFSNNPYLFNSNENWETLAEEFNLSHYFSNDLLAGGRVRDVYIKDNNLVVVCQIPKNSLNIAKQDENVKVIKLISNNSHEALEVPVSILKTSHDDYFISLHFKFNWLDIQAPNETMANEFTKLWKDQNNRDIFKMVNYKITYYGESEKPQLREGSLKTSNYIVDGNKLKIVFPLILRKRNYSQRFTDLCFGNKETDTWYKTDFQPFVLEANQPDQYQIATQVLEYNRIPINKE